MPNPTSAHDPLVEFVGNPTTSAHDPLVEFVGNPTSAHDPLAEFIGKSVILMCANYFYTGTLDSVTDLCAKLTNAKKVFDTGPFNAPVWADAQAFPGGTWYVMLHAVESFGFLK